MSCFNSSWQLSPIQPLAHSPRGGMRERIGRVNVRKLIGWDKGSLIGKAKGMHASKAKQGIHSLPPSGQAGAQLSPGQQGSITRNGYLGRQMPSLRTSLPSFFPQLYMLSMMSYGMEYPFGQLGSAVPAVSPPNLLCTSSLFTGRVGWEAEKALTLCKHCWAITKTSLCYQRCFQHRSKTYPHTSYCED